MTIENLTMNSRITTIVKTVIIIYFAGLVKRKKLTGDCVYLFRFHHKI